MNEKKKKMKSMNEYFSLFLLKLFTNFLNNFIYGCFRSSLMHGLFSSHAMQALGVQASVVVVCGLNICGSQALEHRLGRCSTWA